MKAKKGFVASALTDFYAYVLWVFVIIIFSIVFKFSGNMTETITAEAADINMRTTLLNIARSPVSFDINNDGTDENITLAELIVLTNVDNKNSESYKIMENSIKSALAVLNEQEQPCGIEISITKGSKKSMFTYYKDELSSDVATARRQSKCLGTLSKTTMPLPVPKGYEKTNIELALLAESGSYSAIREGFTKE